MNMNKSEPDRVFLPGSLVLVWFYLYLTGCFPVTLRLI